jgi:hypothetical protein
LVLANKAPKSSASLDEEGGLYFFLFIIVMVALLGIIFDPHQFEDLVGGTLGSIFSPFLAFANGIASFFTSLVSSLWNYVTGSISGVGNSLYKNTIGRL